EKMYRDLLVVGLLHTFFLPYRSEKTLEVTVIRVRKKIIPKSPSSVRSSIFYGSGRDHKKCIEIFWKRHFWIHFFLSLRLEKNTRSDDCIVKKENYSKSSSGVRSSIF